MVICKAFIQYHIKAVCARFRGKNANNRDMFDTIDKSCIFAIIYLENLKTKKYEKSHLRDYCNRISNSLHFL